MIENGRTGLLVEPASPEQFAEAICRVFDDPTWAKSRENRQTTHHREPYIRKYVQRMVALHYRY
jgi:glycosyltransferase involved in cell wall biosynthesis